MADGRDQIWSGWVWLHGEGPNLVLVGVVSGANLEWVGVVVWGGARPELLERCGLTDVLCKHNS